MYSQMDKELNPLQAWDENIYSFSSFNGATLKFVSELIMSSHLSTIPSLKCGYG